MANRILQFLHGPCDCCRERERLREVETRCEAIEDECNGEFEFFVSAKERVIQLIVCIESRDAEFDSDLRDYAISELRAIAGRLLACAGQLEVSR